ncbi:MAG: sugar ABC transporter substrate-binding protein, partial [Mesorhizobium sp.]
MKLTKHLTGVVIASTCLCTPALAQTRLTMWYHGAGNEVESRILNQIISDFNTSQSDWTVTIESFPEKSYNDSVAAAALAGNLPDILD